MLTIIKRKKIQRKDGLDVNEATNHKQGMVSSGTNYSNFNAVFGIPLNKNSQLCGQYVVRTATKTDPCISVKNVNVLACVQVINGTLSVDFEGV